MLFYGLTLFFLEIDGKKYRCEGKIQDISNIYNLPLVLNGRFNEVNGMKVFQFTSYEFYCKNKQEIVQFLKSGLIKNLKYKTAETLADKVIELDINLLDHFSDSYSFGELCKKIPTFAQYESEILKKMQKIVNFKRLFSLISSAGGEYTNVAKLLTKNDNPYQALKRNVYQLGRFCDLTFETCDTLALNEFGYSVYDKRRVAGLIAFCLANAETNGDCYITVKKLIKGIASLQKNSPYPTLSIDWVLPYLINQTEFSYHFSTKENDYIVYFKNTREKELSLSKDIQRINCSKTSLNFNEKYIDSLEKELGITYSNEQRMAFNALKSTGVKIVTGGPGTGKTTTINGLISAYKAMFNGEKKIKLAAPTGRASQRMTESTGMPAETFYRMLECKPYDDGVCKYSETNPYDCDCLILDEMSMAELGITSLLFNAIKNNTLVILVGDVDQLPSVGLGNILEDVIDSKSVEVYRLSVNYRQGKLSTIVSNAEKIKAFDDRFTQDNSFLVKKMSDEFEALNYLNDFINDYQILTPIKETLLGVETINQYIQGILYEDISTSTLRAKYGATTFYLQDKVIATKNNYDKGYFNGETGIVTDIISSGIEITFDDGKVIFVNEAYLSEIQLAYSITIHKSQGSEYQNIILILPEDGASLLTKKLLYTAITRAKKKVIILELNDSISKCLKNRLNFSTRKTLLCEDLAA